MKEKPFLVWRKESSKTKLEVLSGGACFQEQGGVWRNWRTRLQSREGPMARGHSHFVSVRGGCLG